MKRLLSVVAATFVMQSAFAQITITTADMPVSGDTLRYSIASQLTTTFSPADSGTSVVWNYSLTPTAQGADTFRTAGSVNFAYGIIIPTGCGYKVADSLPGVGTLLAGTTITQLYTFFDNSAAEYKAQAFAALIDGLPAPFNYTTPDVWYFFPLTYASTDSSDFKLNITVPSLGGIKETGYRKTRVDGWGTITTPYFTTPANCIRVRSEIHQVDSISISTFTFGLPVYTVEYKWLVNGEHYPALWITTNVNATTGAETVSSVRYRDSYRSIDTSAVNGVAQVNNNIAVLKAFPNPAINSTVTIEVPSAWKTFTIDVYDMQGKAVGSYANVRDLNIGQLPAGQYMARVTSGSNVGYVQFAK